MKQTLSLTLFSALISWGVQAMDQEGVRRLQPAMPEPPTSSSPSASPSSCQASADASMKPLFLSAPPSQSFDACVDASQGFIGPLPNRPEVTPDPNEPPEQSKSQKKNARKRQKAKEKRQQKKEDQVLTGGCEYKTCPEEQAPLKAQEDPQPGPDQSLVDAHKDEYQEWIGYYEETTFCYRKLWEGAQNFPDPNAERLKIEGLLVLVKSAEQIERLKACDNPKERGRICVMIESLLQQSINRYNAVFKVLSSCFSAKSPQLSRLPNVVAKMPKNLTSLNLIDLFLGGGLPGQRMQWSSQIKHVNFSGSIWHDRTLMFLVPYVSGLTSLDITCRSGCSEVSARGLTDFVQGAPMPEMQDLRISRADIDIDDMWDLIEFVKANKQTKFPKLQRLGVHGFKNAKRALTPNLYDAIAKNFQLVLD